MSFDAMSRDDLIAIANEVFALRRRVVELEAENRNLKMQLPRAEAAPIPATPASGFAFGIVDTQGRREVVVPGTFAKLGTDRSCAVKLPGARWMHAAIERDADGTVTILAFDTPEGTFVNGERIKKARLSSGDRIDICDARIVIVFP